MDIDSWCFTKEELALVTAKRGIDASKELFYRRGAANCIEDMGQRLELSRLCMNTAVVYMHRFYTFYSFTDFDRNNVSMATLFLAAKVENQPRKLEYVIKVAHSCLHEALDVRSQAYADKKLEVVCIEDILLQLFGFNLSVDHPHIHIVEVCKGVKGKAIQEVSVQACHMATASLHMTTMCLQYKPAVVACVCIHLTCKWFNWEIEACSEGKEWFYYDETVTLDLLENLTQEFITILESHPNRFTKCIPPRHIPRPLSDDSSKHQSSDDKIVAVKKMFSPPGPSTSSS